MSTPKAYDAENHDAIRFPAILNDVVFEVVFADIGGPAQCWMPNIGKYPDSLIRVFENPLIGISLPAAPLFKRVLNDVPHILAGPWQEDDFNT